VYTSCAGGAREPEIDRIFVFWSPEACIADSMTDDGLSKVVSGNTQVSIRTCGQCVYFCIYLPVMCKSAVHTCSSIISDVTRCSLFSILSTVGAARENVANEPLMVPRVGECCVLCSHVQLIIIIFEGVSLAKNVQYTP